jgi:hypothetical protein
LWGTEFNKARHVQADDARPLKRPFTPTELQQFFDLADLAPERILNAGRKALWRRGETRSPSNSWPGSKAGVSPARAAEHARCG